MLLIHAKDYKPQVKIALDHHMAPAPDLLQLGQNPNAPRSETLDHSSFLLGKSVLSHG